jgi:hypothetical protein
MKSLGYSLRRMTAMVLHSASLSGLVPQKTTSTYSKELQNSVSLRTVLSPGLDLKYGKILFLIRCSQTKKQPSQGRKFIHMQKVRILDPGQTKNAVASGSGSISRRYGSGSGSFDNQAKIVRKT